MSDACCCCCCCYFVVVVLLSPSPGCVRSCVCTLALVGLCYTIHLSVCLSVCFSIFFPLFVSVCSSVLFYVCLYFVCSCLPLFLLLLFLLLLLLSPGLFSLWYLQIGGHHEPNAHHHVSPPESTLASKLTWFWTDQGGLIPRLLLGRWCLVFPYYALCMAKT